MFVVWNAAVLAALPIGSAGDPLEVLRSTGSPLVATGILAFSLSAIVTSFVGFVVALTDFFADLDNRTEDSSLPLKLRDFALTLVPPVIVACLDPSLFFQAIDKAGAFGVSNALRAPASLDGAGRSGPRSHLYSLEAPCQRFWSRVARRAEERNRS